MSSVVIKLTRRIDAAFAATDGDSQVVNHLIAISNCGATSYRLTNYPRTSQSNESRLAFGFGRSCSNYDLGFGDHSGP